MVKKKQKKKPRKINRPKRSGKKNDANVSEAVVAITSSFIENNLDGDITDFNLLVNLSIIGWNMSLFPEMNKENLYGKIAEILPKNFNAANIAGFVDIIEKIITEKKKLYPDVNRLIEKHDISLIDGKIKLDVKSIPFGEKRK